MPADDIPNSFLGRLISLEFLGMLVLIAVSWGALTARVSGLDNTIAEQKELQTVENTEAKKVTTELSREVNQINRKVDVLGANQEHFKNQIDSLDGKLEKIQDLLEKDAH